MTVVVRGRSRSGRSPVPWTWAATAPVPVVLAARTPRDGHLSGPAVVVSGLLLATLVAMPRLVSSAEGFPHVMPVLGPAALVATTGVAVVRSHGRHRTS